MRTKVQILKFACSKCHTWLFDAEKFTRNRLKRELVLISTTSGSKRDKSNSKLVYSSRNEHNSEAIYWWKCIDTIGTCKIQVFTFFMHSIDTWLAWSKKHLSKPPQTRTWPYNQTLDCLNGASRLRITFEQQWLHLEKIMFIA